MVLAAAINAKGDQGILDVIDGLEDMVSDESKQKLARIRARVESGEVSWASWAS